ncbi:TspO/MBR family protein [Thermaurantiacus sp.]
MALADLLSFLPFLALALAAASTGARYKPGPWYAALAKPPLTPPNWVFPLVWSALYLLIAAAGFKVWRAGGWAAWPALAVWAGHLLLNAAWSWLFFGRRRLDLAMAELVVFWLSILATILAFAPHSATAAWLLVPYIAWVTAAGALNWGFLKLNGPRGELAAEAVSAGAYPAPGTKALPPSPPPAARASRAAPRPSRLAGSPRDPFRP